MATALTARQTLSPSRHAPSPVSAWQALQRGLRPGAAAVLTRRALPAGTTAGIARPRGRTVRCESGTLWLTFDHEPQDVILEPGQSHTCAGNARLGVHAMVAAAYSLR